MVAALRQRPLLRGPAANRTVLRARVGVATMGIVIHGYAAWAWDVNLWLLGVSVLQLLVATMVVSDRYDSFVPLAVALEVLAAVSIGVIAGHPFATIPWLVALLPLVLSVFSPGTAVALALTSPLALGVTWVAVESVGQVSILSDAQLPVYLVLAASAPAVAAAVVAWEIGTALRGRELAEEARLREMEVITDHSPIGMAIQDQNRRFIYSNTRLRSMLGLSIDQIERTGLADAVPPEVLARIEPLVIEAQMKGEPVSFDHPIRRSDGSQGWVDVNMSSPLGQADGTVVYVFNVFDITEKMAATVRSRRFADALDGTSDIVLLWDALRRPLHMNAAFLQFFGASEENRAAAVEQVFSTLADKSPRWSQLPGGSAVEFEAEFVRRNASQPTPFSVVVTVGHDEAHGRSFALIGRNISALRRASEELRDVVRSKDQFVASVSHELRTPLAVVLGLAHELAESSEHFDREELAELSGLIAEQSSDVAAIVEDLLMVTRAEAGALAMVVEDVDVEAVVLAAIRSARPYPNVEVDLGQPLMALADEGRLRQVLRNLIVNAQRHGGPKIRVWGEQTDDGLEIIVADSGPEIRAAIQATMFDAYERGHHLWTGPDSVGLGLTVCRTLARLMGGDVVYRHRDGWSEFVVQLSRAIAAPSDSEIVLDDRDVASQTALGAESPGTDAE